MSKEKIEQELQELATQKDQALNFLNNIQVEIIKRQGILEYLASTGEGVNKQKQEEVISGGDKT